MDFEAYVQQVDAEFCTAFQKLENEEGRAKAYFDENKEKGLVSGSESFATWSESNAPGLRAAHNAVLASQNKLYKAVTRTYGKTDKYPKFGEYNNQVKAREESWKNI